MVACCQLLYPPLEGRAENQWLRFAGVAAGFPTVVSTLLRCTHPCVDGAVCGCVIYRTKLKQFSWEYRLYCSWRLSWRCQRGISCRWQNGTRSSWAVVAPAAALRMQATTFETENERTCRWRTSMPRLSHCNTLYMHTNTCNALLLSYLPPSSYLALTPKLPRSGMVM